MTIRAAACVHDGCTGRPSHYSSTSGPTLLDGQDLIEYALLAATISLGVTPAMMLVLEQLI